MSEQSRMSRAVRTARGAFGALAVTLLAATSHNLAGGTATLLAVIATSVLALPLCVLLAGRVGSLWRLVLAVAPAQFVYHWSFAGLGLAQERASQGAEAGLAMSPHAQHLEALNFVPGVAAAGSADALMWASHAVAALLTIVLLHRGERAVLHLIRVLRNTVPTRLPTSVRLPGRPAILEFVATASSHSPQVFLRALSYRGPPAAFALAN